MQAFPDPAAFAFVPALEAAFGAIVAELRALSEADFVESPDSLSAVSGVHDETGWRSYSLYGGGADDEARRERCPATARACAAVPGLVNASFSLFRPGTHLYPHRGENAGVLRCHLALVVPDGDVGLRSGTETRRWTRGRCLLLDDTLEHDAWNRGAGDRVVLIVTFERQAAAER